MIFGSVYVESPRLVLGFEGPGNKSSISMHNGKLWTDSAPSTQTTTPDLRDRKQAITSDNQSQCAKQKLDLNPSLYQNFFGLILTPACQCILLLLPETSLPAVSQPQVLKAEHEGFRSPLVRRQIQSHQLETLARLLPSAVALPLQMPAHCAPGAPIVSGDKRRALGAVVAAGGLATAEVLAAGADEAAATATECSISW